MSELFLPYVCGIINRIHLLYHLSWWNICEIQPRLLCLSPVDIARRAQKLLRKNGRTGRPSDRVRLGSFSAQANSKPVMFMWIDGPHCAFPWSMSCLAETEKSNRVTVSRGGSLKVFFYKGHRETEKGHALFRGRLRELISLALLLWLLCHNMRNILVCDTQFYKHVNP